MRSKELGGVLLIGLLLLIVATIIGVATFNSAFMQERIAGSQRQMVESHMVAETSLTKSAQWLSSASGETFWDALRDAFQKEDNNEKLEAIRTAVGSAKSAIDKQLEDLHFTINLIVMTPNKVEIRAEPDNGAGRVISATYDRNVFFAQAPPAPESAYTCFGADCSVEVHGNATVSGYDYNVPANFNCTGNACNGTPSGGPPVIGVFLPDDGEICRKGGPNPRCGGDAQVNGHAKTYVYGDPSIQTSGTPECGASCWMNYVASFNDAIPHFVASGGNITASSGQLGTRQKPTFTEITGNVKITSHVPGAGVMIVRAGKKLELAGNMHYEGLIILEEDATISFGGGTIDIFGAIIALDGAEGLLDAGFTGDLFVKYSDEALRNLTNIETRSAIGTISSWQEFVPSS